MIPQNDTLHKADRPNYRKKIWTKKIAILGQNMMFWPKFSILVTLTIYIEVEGHMIAQIEALDKTKKLGHFFRFFTF